MEPKSPDEKHPVQALLDNPWWLLAIGVVVPTISYTLWGWYELWMTPPAPLP